ncbi:coiled-coil domain-containing protein 174 [Ostrinia furnacalis]|uniref:coiled-coil domain-containing protein 174 n=1 Tax=Ostrinia furnacalis TaxID=93504 RepID=UPI00103ED0EB|nr:coiled-coil domain-containing protein 174 [Ostrinia furnacalis]
MNESTSKKIIFNKSSLLSLKAELLKKQEEVYEKKHLPQHKIENFKPAPSKPSIEETKEHSKKSFKDSLKAVDTEELEANRKVKAALEKKAELYKHLKDSAGDSQLAGRFLVDFKNKKQQERDDSQEDCNSQVPEASYQDDDNDWVEFTDCLGRTRKCHKSDLDLYMKRDRDLVKILTNDHDTKDDTKESSNTTTPQSEKPLLVQKTNDYLQSLREKWEEKEKELLAKDKDIHYQDLLFDEARIHGVGYYSFSTDETERRRQMDELLKQREETLRAQKEAEAVRKKRDELLAARVAAARARQRARAGLPPEEPKAQNEKDFTTCLLEFLTQQKNEADAKAKEEEKKLREEQEKERQKLRDAYIREWDLGKEGVEGKVKKFREMTQEEYVEQQRSKRIDEFAPPKSSSSSKSVHTFDESGRSSSGLNPSTPKTWSEVRPMEAPPPPDIGDISALDEQKGLYFSTKKPANTIKYKNFVQPQEPTPIENELSDDEGEGEQIRPQKRKSERDHSEIAPPPTYDYYGPTPKHSRPKKPFESDIREAYAQGAKSLEAKGNDRQLSKAYDFTFD